MSPCLRGGSFRRTTATLAALAATATAALADDAPSPAAIRAARDAVLARPEFRYHEAPQSESLFMRLFRGWAEFLQGLHDAHPVAYFAFMTALAALAAALVIHIVWTIQVARRSRWADDDASDLEAAMRRLDAAPFRARALAHAAAGRLDEAVRDLYTALLLTLDRRGALRYAGHKALLDYRIECAADADARAALDAFADAYPPGSFGRRPPDPARFRSLVATLDAVAAPAERTA